ncbi:tRNA-intron endonuclease [Phytophthora palmivora]|uniref:tRNA-intron lyase n=1 Tax=Phytophthora palmivora TaxID=4796 RepID=A0A2P4XTR3_9STRA|nr:tRNA-intron endonuclease [Phytophthora palmivora]
MNYAVATVVPDAEATYALVNDPQHVAFLQKQCRIYGSPEGTTTALRLALEEMAVGIAKGFLRLETTVTVYGDYEGKRLVEEITLQLTSDKKRREAGDTFAWTLSPQRHDRLRVFRDLWERGYVVTFGSKFGADFLIYKDDPKRAHAVALIVVKGFEEEFARLDVVSFCRVAKMVKKKLMFACVQPSDADKNDDEKGDSKDSGSTEVAADKVVYISLTHALLVSRQEETGEE